VALVTGSNRGIGAEFVRQLHARGAAKVYAASRGGADAAIAGVQGVTLDVTDERQAARLAAELTDVDLLVNNAGIATGASLVTGDFAEIRREFETNVFGSLSLTRAFARNLASNGGGAVLNVLSAATWFAAPGATAYAATKAAAWSMTDGLRVELASQRTQVLGLHMAVVDAGMGVDAQGPKVSVDAVVSHALDGLEAGAAEVLVDDVSRQLKSNLHQDPIERYAGLI